MVALNPHAVGSMSSKYTEIPDTDVRSCSGWRRMAVERQRSFWLTCGFNMIKLE